MALNFELTASDRRRIIVLPLVFHVCAILSSSLAVEEGSSSTRGEADGGGRTCRPAQAGGEAWNQWRRRNPRSRPALVGARLRGADLREVDLGNANLFEADLRHANLFGANLRGATLLWADLRGADLREADLSYATLFGAKLSGANLFSADLCDAAFLEPLLRRVLTGHPGRTHAPRPG